MTTARFLLVLLILATACRSGTTPVSIKGKWSNTTVQGGKTYEFIGYFREDGTYDGILNGKVLVSGGSYKVTGDTIAFADAICNKDYIGKYKLTYKGDSVRFDVIADSCRVRREGTDGMGFKKLPQ